VTGGRFLVTRPLDAEAIRGGDSQREEIVVVYDDLGASPGTRIAFSEGGEAAQPFRPKSVPIDAYNAAILDTVSVGDGEKEPRK
jgi:ethanolamine utilization protein EutN